MPLVQLNDLTLTFRGPALLDGVNCVIERGDRVGLLGRNGAGKTSLMNLIAGKLTPDHGQVQLEAGARLAILRQDVPHGLELSVADVVRQGAEHHAEDPSDAWRVDHAVEKVLSKMQLDGVAEFDRLSSGMKRRVLLAQALVGEPDLLLLDEPTNHLDIAAIGWLEQFLTGWRGTLLFVTHDREFLRRLATRIVEIDRGKIYDWACDYTTFLERKEQMLAAEEKQNALFDKRLAEEERWIRQGIKARRTRNEGRVRALKALRVERSNRRERTGAARLAIQEAERSGALVAEAEGVAFRYGDREIFSDFSTALMRGDKIGVIGPNGVGKTTLLRVLLGQLPPTSGRVRLGTNLRIAYFDQLRDQLDPEKTVQENVGEGYDTVDIAGADGKPIARHVLGYLQDFLFTPDRARSLVKVLSGGERNRVLLAKLFAKPANVIVLDEPTNDLDAETMEMLEEKLIEFGGTLLIVSHDRAFLNNVVTSTLVFEPEGLREYVGGYDDWVRQRRDAEAEAAAPKAKRATPGASKPEEPAPRAAEAPRRKLTFNEQRELKSLPATIEKLEKAIAALHTAMSAPDFFQQPPKSIAAKQAEATQLQTQLELAFNRWEELDQAAVEA